MVKIGKENFKKDTEDLIINKMVKEDKIEEINKEIKGDLKDLKEEIINSNNKLVKEE